MTHRRWDRLDALFWGCVGLVVAVFAAGAWQRRWIADDGLIVLRTVRNLVAGNGPVFNAGERVESNTSVLWTYVVYAAHALTGYRLEMCVLALALGCSLLAVFAAAAGTRLMLGAPTRRLLLLPFGVIVYVVLPPARDFATSGLETGLIICWIAVVWWLAQRWARAPHRRRRWALPAPGSAALALVAGLAPLVRPELLLLGAPLLLLLAVVPQRLGHLAWVVAIAGAAPVGYQVWRMSYYALPYPITAVAKDAGGAKWGKGLAYLTDLADPYVLAVPAVCALAAGAVVAVVAWRGREATTLRLRERARGTGVVTAVFVLVALVLMVYEVRVGGDFMHGRVLLPALFTALLPVAVLPLPVGPAPDAAAARSRRVLVPVAGAAWLVVVGWAVWVQWAAEPFRDAPEEVTASGIVDERQFYLQRTGHRHPLLAEDYLDFPRMRALQTAVRTNQTGAVYISVPVFQDRWDVVSYDHPRPGMAAYQLPEHPEQTVIFLNLGMTSMNLPLDVKVYDTVGLATPLAAHTHRMPDGRIGHDKFLPYDWFLARAEVVENPESYPSWVDQNWVLQSRAALTCPATEALIESYAGPLTLHRRLDNLMNAFSYAEYRIDRIPAYEVQRCGLPMPEKVEKHPGTR